MLNIFEMAPPTKIQKIYNTKLTDGTDTKIQLNTEVSDSFPEKHKVTTDRKNVYCRDYIWGTCNKNESQCRFLHARDIDHMKKIIQFCNDFQNIGCKWPKCSYLHTSREEKKLFLEQGILPQILLDRYAEVEAKVANSFFPKPDDALTATDENFISEQNSVNYNQPPPINLLDHTKPPPFIPIPAAATEYVGPPAKRRCRGLNEAPTHQNYNGEQFPIDVNQPPSLINLGFDHTKPPPIIPIPAAAAECIGPLANGNCMGSHEDTSDCQNKTNGTQEKIKTYLKFEFSIKWFNMKIKNSEDEEKNEKTIIYQQKIEKHFVSEMENGHKNIIEKFIDGNNSSPSSDQTNVTQDPDSVAPKSSEDQTEIQQHFVTLSGALIDGNKVKLNGDTIDMSSSDALISDATDTFILVPEDNDEAEMAAEILEPEPETNRQIYDPKMPPPNYTPFLQHKTPTYNQLIGGALIDGNKVKLNGDTIDMLSSDASISATTDTFIVVPEDNGEAEMAVDIPEPETNRQIYDPKMPPPNYMPFLEHTITSYIQPNEPPKTVPPPSVPMPPPLVMKQQYIPFPFQTLSHPAPYFTFGSPGPFEPYFGMSRPGLFGLENPYPFSFRMPQVPPFSKPLFPPLPPYLPPQNPPLPPGNYY